MPFCTNCGSRLEVESRFCVGCGKSNGTRPLPAVTAAAPAPAPEPLDYTIQGESLQLVRIRLKPGQDVFAEAGRMVYKFPEVHWEARPDREFPGQTRFYAVSPSEVGFAGAFPGRIQAFDLKAGQSMLVAREAFVCAQGTARLDRGLATGDGFVLERLTGPGTLFVHAAGEFIEFALNPGQVLEVSAASIVALDESVRSQLQPDHGLLLAALTGPGRVVIQTRTIARAPSLSTGEVQAALPAMTGTPVSVN
jgi:uncharacterized protein (AIM24 family)